MHSTADTPCCLVLTTSKPATASPVPGMHDERVCTPSYWRSRRRQQHNSPARHAPVRAHNHAREWWRAGGEPAVASERVRRRWCMYWGSGGETIDIWLRLVARKHDTILIYAFLMLYTDYVLGFAAWLGSLERADFEGFKARSLVSGENINIVTLYNRPLPDYIKQIAW